MRRAVLACAAVALGFLLLNVLIYLIEGQVIQTGQVNPPLLFGAEILRGILNAVAVYLGIVAWVLALYETIHSGRRKWFTTVLLSAIVSLAATELYEHPVELTPSAQIPGILSVVFYFLGYLSLASVLAYGIAGLRDDRRKQATTVADTAPVSDTPAFPDVTSQPGSIPEHHQTDAN